MAPLFWLQVVKPDGSAVRGPFGSPLERELVRACTEAIVARGTRVPGSQTVLVSASAIEAGVAEVIRALKYETVQVV